MHIQINDNIFVFRNTNPRDTNPNLYHHDFTFTNMNTRNQMLLNVNTKTQKAQKVKIRHFSQNLNDGTGSLKKREF